MSANLHDVLISIYGVLRTASPIDILDILVLSYVVYFAIKLIRETRAGSLMKGIIFLVIVYMLASWANMKAISFLMQKAFNIGLIALIILFQPELRRTLEKAGYSKFGFHLSSDPDEQKGKWGNAIEAICDACVELSASTTGALIVVERQTRLGEQIENGTILNATPSKELFGNIFYNKTPLHDGAVIMRDGSILAAACFLPKPQKEERIDKRLGSRHRAAIGMSENSDAIVIVVSEETGSISVAENGTLTSGYTREKLHTLLCERLYSNEGSIRLPSILQHIPGISNLLKKKKKKEESNHEVD